MAFTLRDYWMPQPDWLQDPSQAQAFNRLIDAGRTSPVLEYTLDAPKWQFLCHLAEARGFVLHGSPVEDIDIFEPRQPADLHAFGAQNAVYAASDGIWPMYFAILNRQQFPTSLINACLRVEHPRGQVSAPHYFFSIERDVLARNPFRPGWVYVLPGETFFDEGAVPAGEDTWVRVAQVASLQPVRPVARLRVEPRDFPFLHHIRGHDPTRLQEYAQAMEQGLPLPEPRSPEEDVGRFNE